MLQIKVSSEDYENAASRTKIYGYAQGNENMPALIELGDEDEAYISLRGDDCRKDYRRFNNSLVRFPANPRNGIVDLLNRRFHQLNHLGSVIIYK